MLLGARSARLPDEAAKAELIKPREASVAAFLGFLMLSEAGNLPPRGADC